jgi:tetratricopeptide (TPR) repeat protein
MKKLLVLFILFPLMLNGQNAAKGYINSGLTKETNNDPKGAYEDYSKAIALDPSSVTAYMHRASTYRGENAHEKSLKDLDKAISLAKPGRELSECWWYRGLENRNYGDIDESIIDFTNGIVADRTHDYNYLTRGQQYLKMDKIDLATLDFESYLKICGADDYCFANIGMMFADVKLWAKAIEYYDKAITLEESGNDVDVLQYLDRARCKVQINDFNGAIKDYQKVVAVAKSKSEDRYYAFRESYFEMGWIYKTVITNEPQAIESFKLALPYYKNDDRNKWVACILTGQKEEAFSLFSTQLYKDIEAFKQSKSKIQIFQDYYYGCVLYALCGDGPKAVGCLDSALNQGVTMSNLNVGTLDRYLDNIKYRSDYKRLLAKYNIPYTVPPLPVADLIKLEVTQQMQSWQEKGEFETNAQYMVRMKTRDAQVKKFTDQAINQLKKDQLDEIARASVRVGKYDAESETFKISFNDKYDAIVSVPIADAPSFRDNSGKLKYSKQDFMIQNDQWVLSNLTVVNPTNQKQFNFDIRKQADYNPNQQFVLRYEDIKVDIPKSEMTSTGKQEASKQAKPIELGLCDVDVNIPASAEKNPNLFVIAIGNEDYAKSGNLDETVNVPFARNDAKMFKQYAEKCLGAQSDHIRFLQDATLAQMKNAVNWIGEVAKVYSNAEIIFYYAGHGLPDDQQKESYLIPVDATPSDLSTAIKLSDVYSKLMRVPTQRVTVFLDACFSGGGRNSSLIAARSVKITPKPEEIEGKLVIFNATSGDQTALPYTDKQHGMFTYYLLKKIQETQGKATYKELSDYLSAKVSQQSIITNNKPQSPKTDLSPYVQDTWGTWTLR